MLSRLSRLRLCATIRAISWPGSSVHGIFQARLLERIAISFSREPSRLRDQTCISCMGSQILHHLSHQLNPFLISRACMLLLSRWSCPTLCDPMDWSLPGSSVRGILQARILEWAVRLSSRGVSWPRDWTHVFYLSYIDGWVLYH